MPKTILLTRPEHQAQNLIFLLKKLGYLTQNIPFYQIKINNISQEILEKKLENSEIWIASSANAILPNKNLICHIYQNRKNKPVCAAVGESTAKIWANMLNINIENILYPKDGSGAEKLLALLQHTAYLHQKIVLFQGENALGLFEANLKKHGAIPEVIESYRREICLCENWQTILPTLSAAIITSGTALENMIAQTAYPDYPCLKALPLIVPSARVAQIADKFGFLRYDTVLGSVSDVAMVTRLQSFLS